MDFTSMVKLSGKARPCSIQPEDLITTETNADGSAFAFLSYQSKALWFWTWCAENGKSGWIDDGDIEVHPLSESVAMVIAKATIYIDGQYAGHSSGSKAFLTADVESLNAVVQAAATTAKSRALSNAGFGAVCTSKLDDIPQLLPDYLQNPVTQPSITATTMPQAVPAYPPVNPGTPRPAPAMQAPQSMPVPQPTAVLAPMAQAPALDPVAAAKQIVYPGKGINCGKTLGTILQTKPKDIKWIAEKYPKPEIQAAAKLLEPEANRLLGL